MYSRSMGCPPLTARSMRVRTPHYLRRDWATALSSDPIWRPISRPEITLQIATSRDLSGGLLHRHALFEFLEPVKHHADLRSRRGGRSVRRSVRYGNEALAVWCDVMISRRRGQRTERLPCGEGGWNAERRAGLLCEAHRQQSA